MNFEFTREQMMEADLLRTLVGLEIAPDAPVQDESEPAIREEILRRHFKKLGAIGFLGLSLPENAGGRGRGALEWTLQAEIVAKASPATFLSSAMSAVAACAPIAKFGSDGQRGQWTAAAARGEKTGSFALAEPEGGSDMATVRTRARRVKGGWVLDGRKAYVLNAPVCDFVVVLATTAEEGGPSGSSLFVVDAGAKGFRWEGRRETMGHRGAPMSDVILESCQVGDDALIGGENQGFGYAMHGVQMARLAACCGALGVSSEALRHALAFARARKSRGKSILKHQEVSFKIAQMHAMIDIGRLLTQYAAWSVDEGDADAGPNVSCAKVHTTESAVKISSMAVQILGAAGYMVGNPVERLYRDARAFELIHGPTEIQRVLLAQDALRKFGG